MRSYEDILRELREMLENADPRLLNSSVTEHIDALAWAIHELQAQPDTAEEPRANGEIAPPAPSWQPSELALIASVFADAAHEAGESDEEDVRLEAPMLSALSRKAALAVPRDYNPLPPAPPQAPERDDA